MTTRDLLHLEAIPVYQNKMFDTASAARQCPRGDVILTQNRASGLVYNRMFDPDKLTYDDSYQNEQNHSPAFQTHIALVLEKINHHFGAMSILEIGCGKGVFLQLMRSAGHEARGIDPAYEGESPYVVRRRFEAGLGIRGDAIVLRHVLEHIAGPFEFLDQVRHANGGHGLVYIEVPCLDWILQRRAWFDVFYEHVNYFRLDDFERMFRHVRESGHLFGGQYIYVVAELGSLRDPAGDNIGLPLEVHIPSDFFASLDRCAAATSQGSRRAVWGAAAKGVMFSHHMAARGLAPELAIDINQAKQDHFLAGSGLPVLSPQAALAQLGDEPDVFVMNSNYLPEVRAMGGVGPNYIAVDQK